MPACAVANCRNYTKTTKGTSVKYFSFPRDLHQREEWVQRCGRETDFNIANSRICSEHFTKDDFERDLKNELLGLPVKRILKPLSLPTVAICSTTRPIIDYFKSSAIHPDASDDENISTASDSGKNDKSLNSECTNCATVTNKQSINKSGKLRKYRRQFVCCENGKRRLTFKRKQAEDDEESDIDNCSSKIKGLYVQYKKQCEKLKAENYKLKMCLKSFQVKFQINENDESNSSVNWEESYKALKINYDALQNKLTNCVEVEFDSLKEDESPKEFEFCFPSPDFHQYALPYPKKEDSHKTFTEEAKKTVLNEDMEEENEEEKYTKDSSSENSIILIEIPGYQAIEIGLQDETS